MENESYALPFQSGVKNGAQQQVQAIETLCILIQAAYKNRADVIIT